MIKSIIEQRLKTAQLSLFIAGLSDFISKMKYEKRNSIKILIDSGESNSVHLKLSVFDNCFRISIIPQARNSPHILRTLVTRKKNVDAKHKPSIVTYLQPRIETIHVKMLTFFDTFLQISTRGRINNIECIPIPINERKLLMEGKDTK